MCPSVSSSHVCPRAHGSLERQICKLTQTARNKFSQSEIVIITNPSHTIIAQFSYITVPYCSNTTAIFGRSSLSRDQTSITIPELDLPLQTSAPHLQEGVLSTTYDLTCNKPTYTADLHWNRISNLGTSGSENKALPQAH
ncbi:hypothetical protein AVEN_87161-1 [Araneus ventricosus]|uniref:Uncharacterized protein n=1 Tax=Araneus ventricosus TaxID=182803 RepID=A0A4Y2H120_ARAVE|nr:hypothetical protein AVEN_87161-1 [Araneus ventricosus]